MAFCSLHITAAELKVLKVLWNLGSGTVRDVLERLSAVEEETPAYTTVMTLMTQLADKGAVAVDKERQPFLYHPVVRREQVLGHRLRQFLQQVFDGQAGELVLRLVEEADLSSRDLKRIEAKIAERERRLERGGQSPRGRTEQPS
jgi:predicted transcriptional regulator